MQVNFFATFRTITGKKTVYFDLAENTTAAQLLQVMIDTFPALKKFLFTEDGKLSPHVHFYINGQDVQLSALALETPLKSQDKVDIFPPVAGGEKSGN